MNKIILFIFMIFGINILFSQETIYLPYTQLIGLKVGGTFYIGTNFGMSGSSYGVFFENVIGKVIGPLGAGFSLEVNSVNVPINSYTIPSSTNTIFGSGERQYADVGGEFKFYLYWVSFNFGLSFTHLYSGYIVENLTYKYSPILPGLEWDLLRFNFGLELCSQINKDLFSKIGTKFIWCFDDNFSYTRGILAFISLGFSF